MISVCNNLISWSAPQTYVSEQTGTGDDATAFVACPAGNMAVKCECDGKNCDGAWFVGDECRVTHSGKSGTSKVKSCIFFWFFRQYILLSMRR